MSSYKPKEEPDVLSPGHQYPPDHIRLGVNPMEYSFCGISVVRMLLHCCFYPHCVVFAWLTLSISALLSFTDVLVVVVALVFFDATA